MLPHLRPRRLSQGRSRRQAHCRTLRPAGPTRRPSLGVRLGVLAEIPLPLAVEQAKGPASRRPGHVDRAGPGSVAECWVGTALQQQAGLRVSSKTLSWREQASATGVPAQPAQHHWPSRSSIN
jgi:hypothetical protein